VPIAIDRVQQTSPTTGTGTYTLAGSVSGYRAFSALSDGAVVDYVATEGNDYEVGRGTYASAGGTLSRDHIYASSNAGAAVNWAAGTRSVWVDQSARAIKVVEVEVDLGAAAKTSAVVDIAVADAHTSHKVLVCMSAAAATGKQEDEAEMDVIGVRGVVPSNGTVRLYFACIGGVLHDRYKVLYQLALS
jgi:hypothetical protein